MRIPRLYINQPLQSDIEVNLERDKAHHISHVLRMRIGDRVKLFNDADQEYLATLKELNKKTAILEIEDGYSVNRESKLEIVLGLGISRGQHMDYSIQKAVELGTYEIVPVITEFSNVKIQDGRKENKLSHWRNIIINATEQSGRTRLTKLREPVTFREYLNNVTNKNRFIFHPLNSRKFDGLTINSNGLNIMVGPEGGFSENEIITAQDYDFIVVDMGPRILRAETAVVTALSICQHRWGDLS